MYEPIFGHGRRLGAIQLNNEHTVYKRKLINLTAINYNYILLVKCCSQKTIISLALSSVLQ